MTTPSLQPLPISSLSSLQQQLGGLPSSASLTTLPPLSQLSQAVAALQQQQQQQQSSASLFSAPLPLGSLNLTSLLLPYSSAVQPLSAQSPPPAASQLAALTGGLSLSLPASDSSMQSAVSNSALLQLQASLLQAAQTGNAAAIQQLQSLNALMQQHSQAPAAPAQPLSTSSTPQQTLQSLFAPVSLLPSTHHSPASVSNTLSVDYARGSSVSPPHRLLHLAAEHLSQSPQRVQLSPPLGASRGSAGSAFRPRVKRDREGGSGAVGGTTAGNGGVSAKQALKSSHLRADVREAVAASQRDARVPVVPLSGSTSSNTDSGGNSSSPSNQLTGDSTNGSSGSGSGSGSDEEQMKQADDESEDEREGKKRRRKRPSSGSHGVGSGSGPSAAKHPFHLFSSLDTSSSDTGLLAHKPPAVPLPDIPTSSKDGTTNPLMYLYVPQQPSLTTGHAASTPDVSALSSLLSGGGSAAVSGFPAASSSISSSSAALSALSSYLNGAGASGQSTTPLLSGLDASLQQQLNQQQQQLLQQIQLQHTQQQQQQQQQARQQSAPSPTLSLPPAPSASTLHGTPLHLVSQHFRQTHGHAQNSSDSGSGSGSGSSSGTGGRSTQHGLQHPQSVQSTSSSSSSSGGAAAGQAGGKKMRKKHIVTDRQRRAKIKDGMEQLRTLLSSHGSFTTDQVSIMMASVQLIQKLRGELSSVKQHTAQMKAELGSYKQQFGLLPGNCPNSPSPSMDASSSSDRLSPLTLLTAATNQAGGSGSGGVDGEKADRRGSGGKRGGALHSKLSVDLSPSRSQSLTKPMAAMSMSGSDTSNKDSSGSGSGSDDGSRPSSGDDTSPFPPERADDGEADSGSSASSGSGRSQQDERSITPDSGAGRRSSDVSGGTTDSGSREKSAAEQRQSQQHRILLTIRVRLMLRKPIALRSVSSTYPLWILAALTNFIAIAVLVG